MKLIIALVFTFIFSSLSSQTMYQPHDMFADMLEGDRAVVVAVHSGVADQTKRQHTIDLFNQRLRAEFPQCEFREAWTSRNQISILAQSGKFVQTPSALFAQLRKEGFTHVLVQPSCMVQCEDMRILTADAEASRPEFKSLRIGDPLLSSPDNCTKLALTIQAALAQRKQATILVCAGTGNPMADAPYSVLDCVVRDSEIADRCFVAIADGYPSFEVLLKRLKSAKVKKVNLVPCMFVADDDMLASLRGEWTEQLTQEGFKVEVTESNMAELAGVLDIFAENARRTQELRKLTPLEIKTLRRMNF